MWVDGPRETRNEPSPEKASPIDLGRTSLPTEDIFSTSAAVKVDMDTDLHLWLNSRLCFGQGLGRTITLAISFFQCRDKQPALAITM
jgi:hypothetical protein